MENLPEINKSIFVHYSCDMFQIGGTLGRVFAIGVRADENTEIWSATDEQEEITAIRSLYNYLERYPHKVLVHWNMDKYEFGPQDLIRRYKHLTGLDVPEISNKWVNLTEYLWNKYGEYAPHPRLRNLCEMNQINLYGSHVDPDNYNTAQAKAYKVVTHLAAIERIHYKEERGTLRVNIPGPVTTDFGFAEFIKEDKRERLMPFLIQTYKDKRPQPFSYMLYALHNLDLIGKPDQLGDVDLHRAIEATFGVKWTRQALTTNINKLNKASISHEVKINQHKKTITEFLYRFQK